MNITFINPASTSVYAKFKRSLIKRIPVGLAYVAAHVERAGYTVKIVDADALDLDTAATARSVMDTRPDIVGITATTPLIHTAVGVLKEIKNENPRIHTIVGGPHTSALPQETLSGNQPFVDFVVFGEGERSCLDLVQAIESEDPLSSPLPGVGYLDPQGRPVIGPPRSFQGNIDSIPFPARHLLPMERYVDCTKFGQELYTLIVSSRGCPSQCTFCGSQVTWKRTVRFRSSENVMAEMLECMDRYGITNFAFCDDTFTLRKEHTIAVCRKILELPRKVRLFCSSRVNTICPERLFWLKKAGCYCVTFGIESGNDKVLKKMKKGINVKKVKEAVRITQSEGIQVHGSFIIGNLGDTEETIEETIQFALDLNLEQVQFSILVPLPGTECYEMAREMKAFRCPPEDYESFYWYYSVAANLTALSDDRLIELQQQAYHRWNLSKQGSCEREMRA